MAFECQVCGCVYGWEMFFHNHLRDVHGIATKWKAKRMKLSKQNVDFLEGYFNHTCQHPSLEEIELLAKLTDLKKRDGVLVVCKSKQEAKAKKNVGKYSSCGMI